ncbi:MAG TPA: Minf_1886 family protein [Tepidisphaeraceae bacterium]|nr:Minf_1886 family protein [Tepidisphaeraceae bacterium]
MPPSPESKQKAQPPASAHEAADYPREAYEFIDEGLQFTVEKVHGRQPARQRESRHVSGRQLCDGLRELALAKWGRLARTVLRRWNITSTLDFGQIVFAMIQASQMKRCAQDSIDDFKNVYEFKAAFETGYKIPGGA